MLLGEITLNLSCVLYFFFYLPQLWHNLKYQCIDELSLSFHALLFISATADLFYGFGRIIQWQYCLISVVLFVCLLFQHVQLFCAASRGSLRFWILIFISVLVIIMLAALVMVLQRPDDHRFCFVFMGWVERCGYWFYIIPQFLNNMKTSSARAISPYYLLMAAVSALCDCISAWCFSWGPSSRYGSPFSFLLHFMLLVQCVGLKEKRTTKVNKEDICLTNLG